MKNTIQHQTNNIFTLYIQETYLDGMRFSKELFKGLSTFQIIFVIIYALFVVTMFSTLLYHIISTGTRI